MPVKLGNLTVYTGPMFSEKSARLLSAGEIVQYDGRRFFAFKSKQDKRRLHAETPEGCFIESRMLKTVIPAVPIQNAWDMVAYAERHGGAEGVSAVLVDEVQFFSAKPAQLKHIRDAVEWFLRPGLTLIIGGCP